MLFNSYEFLLVFLPITLLGYFVAGRRNKVLAAAWLAFMSLCFYGWWDYRYVPLLLASALINFGFGLAIAKRYGTPAASALLRIAIVIDLGLLAWFKYAGFFARSIDATGLFDIAVPEIVLPLGISFFTFTQIAFLVDAHRGKVTEYRFVHYLLFVTYFPHLIAGPVLHHAEMMPQFDQARNYSPRLNNFLIGGSIFIFGLAKKVLLADNLAPHAAAVFEGPGAPSLLIAWGGALAYTFQLYFDFSGYSDMAIGLSRLFGIRLPLNFNSPYKASSIVDFWRRWHMTLSRFLRDYLYLPLGGNRKGRARRYVNLFATMLLGGLWHGAGWTYVFWGGLHGLYLCINHAWQALAGERQLPRGVAAALTFLSVVVAWVFFRAANFTTAVDILKGMAGLHGVALPDAIVRGLGPLGTRLTGLGIEAYLGGGQRFVQNWSWVALGALIAFVMPNTQEFHARLRPALEPVRTGWLRWRPNAVWAIGLGALAAAGILSLSRPSEFLYFQF